MIILTDGKKTVSVGMMEWDGGSYSPRLVRRFFRGRRAAEKVH